MSLWYICAVHTLVNVDKLFAHLIEFNIFIIRFVHTVLNFDSLCSHFYNCQYVLCTVDTNSCIWDRLAAHICRCQCVLCTHSPFDISQAVLACFLHSLDLLIFVYHVVKTLPQAHQICILNTSRVLEQQRVWQQQPWQTAQRNSGCCRQG